MPPMVLPTAVGPGRGPRYAPELPLPRGERNRKLIADGCIVAAREERLLDIWCRRLQEELLAIDAPVLAALKGSLDPGRPFDHNSGGHTRSVHETKHTWPVELFMARCFWDLVELDHPTHLEHKRLSHTKPSSRKHHSIKNF